MAMNPENRGTSWGALWCAESVSGLDMVNRLRRFLAYPIDVRAADPESASPVLHPIPCDLRADVSRPVCKWMYVEQSRTARPETQKIQERWIDHEVRLTWLLATAESDHPELAAQPPERPRAQFIVISTYTGTTVRK